MLSVFSCLLGSVQVLLWSGAGVLELWVTQSYWTQQRLKVWDITEDFSSHVCIVLSVCVTDPTGARYTHKHKHATPFDQLLFFVFFFFLFWSSVGQDGKRLQSCTVSNMAACFSTYRLTEPAGAQWGFFSFLFFALQWVASSLDPSFSLPLSLSAACSPVVVALILIGRRALNTLQFSVECDTLYIIWCVHFTSLWFPFLAQLFIKSH